MNLYDRITIQQLPQKGSQTNMKLKAQIHITLKPSVSDPQGLTVAGGLKQLGFNSVDSVRVGKFIEIEVEAQSREKAENDFNEMCEKLLANPVIEDYKLSII